MTARGYFVIADLTGYTAFFTQSHLEDAQGVLNFLLDGLLRAFRPPLTVSNFQGDAILAYVPEGSFIRGQTLLEMLENLYVTFAGLLDEAHRSSCCDCAACANMPKLDLKLAVHYGAYALQKIGGREELSGPDVILVHRMMKNDVPASTGIRSYALLTEAAVRAMELGDLRGALRPYSAEYEHLGRVPMLVHDLRVVFERERAARRITVPPEGAWLAFETALPVPPPLGWDYLTQPDKVRQWWSLESIRTDAPGGRVDVGSRFVCHRRTGDLDYAIVDWRPFDYFTVEGTGFGGTAYRATYRLAPDDGGCRFAWHWACLSGDRAAETEPLYRTACQEAVSRLRGLIETDRAGSLGR